MKIKSELAVAVLLPAFSVFSFADQQKILWSVGKSDNTTTELAHAPSKYLDYKSPGFFVVGKSKAKFDWPYIQPGPLDKEWSSGSSQTFSVWFAMASPQRGGAQLILDLSDTHEVYPPKLTVEINGKKTVHVTPRGNGSHSDPGRGREHLITIPIPEGGLKEGLNSVFITTSTGSWLTWDGLRLEASADNRLAGVSSHNKAIIQSISSPSVLFWKDGEKTQRLDLQIAHLGPNTKAQVVIGNQTKEIELKYGQNTIPLYITPIKQSGEQVLTLKKDNKVLSRKTVFVKSVRQWDVHIIHQTHLDIGYTHTQEEVLAMQVRHMKAALKEIKRTKNYPPESRFKFHPEGMWAVEEFFRTASQGEKEEFVTAARDGSIHMDALYAQALTGLYTEEEMFELVASAKKFEKRFGVKIDTAMMSDVPGTTWGLATTLAQHGVKYLSCGPNAAHRVGRIYDWADKPFYWVSPSGKHKILYWLPEGGYSRFMGSNPGVYDVKDNMLMKRIGGIWQTLDRLEKKNYPYDMVHIRYAIGSDNGPPDLTLSDVVKKWNEKYASPKLIISKNSDMLKEFEKRYGKEIPVVKGDFTPFWEDGCASTSEATSINRRANEKLQQAQILWSMIKPGKKLHSTSDAAWQKMIMYDEHTWGAWNSISSPESEFVLKQERYKKQFAVDGAKITSKMIKSLLSDRVAPDSSVIDVFNTQSWNRMGLVTLEGNFSKKKIKVEDEGGHPVLSQILSSGKLVFMATDVPAFGSKRYKLSKGNVSQSSGVEVKNSTLSNELIRVEVNPQTGGIQSLFHKQLNKEFVDQSDGSGELNSYLQVIGRDSSKGRNGVSTPVTITVEDHGPLVATLKIESKASGCNKLIRRVRIVRGSDRVEFINTLDKLGERRPEGVYFGFPFNIPNGRSRIDIPWAVIEPEKDQIKGSNRNFYCVQRWLDISNNDYGLTWVSVDAPMIQYSPIVTTGANGSHQWRDSIKPKQHFYSWVMNNHWETNYKASQQGKYTFKYVLDPHAGKYDAFRAQQIGREICQPMIAVTIDPAAKIVTPLLRELPKGIIATMVRPARAGNAMIVRLFGTSDDQQKVWLRWNHKIGKTWLSDPMENKLKELNEPISIKKFEVVTLLIEMKK